MELHSQRPHDVILHNDLKDQQQEPFVVGGPITPSVINEHDYQSPTLLHCSTPAAALADILYCSPSFTTHSLSQSHGPI